MKRVVLTGGPCSGKSTVQQALREEFSDRIVIIPEAATMLLDGGFPIPGKHIPWSPHWQDAFQAAVTPLQQSLEESYLLVAHSVGKSLLVCDRGLLDGAAYTPGGKDEFCRRYSLDLNAVLGRYHAVIHLESLATAHPERYGTSGNASRYESLQEAIRVEQATRAAWADHPNHRLICGKSIEIKVAEVVEFVRTLLTVEWEVAK